MIFAAIFIKLDDPKGPILFKQERLGKDEKIFKVYKFRTMKVETYKYGKVLTDTERVTKIGKILRKTSIDELPQIFNVIRGDMSFIGPRPLPIVYLPYYTKFEKNRHNILPGISGWAQVNGRNAITWEEKFKLDIYYVDNKCLLLDFKIFILTIKKVFIRENVVLRDQSKYVDSLHEIRANKKDV